jgi:ribonucleoside-diphosphate reductase alpha chain
VELGEDFGYRNAQATVLAPTGTIGFMMDCDTTGVEPDIALVKYKKLVGGGMMKIVNQTVPMALKRLGYTAAQVDDIVKYIDEQETIEGAPHLLERDLPVFDCAFKASPRASGPSTTWATSR